MPAKLDFDAPAIRAAVKQQVDRTSLRATADEIGVSKSGLDSFLKGRNPYSRTRTRLLAWWVRNRGPKQASVTPAEVDAAIAILESYMQAVGSDEVRRRRVREVTRRLFET